MNSRHKYLGATVRYIGRRNNHRDQDAQIGQRYTVRDVVDLEEGILLTVDDMDMMRFYSDEVVIIDADEPEDTKRDEALAKHQQKLRTIKIALIEDQVRTHIDQRLRPQVFFLTAWDLAHDTRAIIDYTRALTNDMAEDAITHVECKRCTGWGWLQFVKEEATESRVAQMGLEDPCKRCDGTGLNTQAKLRYVVKI